MARNTQVIRVDPALKKLFEDVKIDKIKLGMNKKLLSDKRLSLAIARLLNIKDVLVKADIKDKKK